AFGQQPAALVERHRDVEALIEGSAEPVPFEAGDRRPLEGLRLAIKDALDRDRNASQSSEFSWIALLQQGYAFFQILGGSVVLEKAGGQGGLYSVDQRRTVVHQRKPHPRDVDFHKTQ